MNQTHAPIGAGSVDNPRRRLEGEAKDTMRVHGEGCKAACGAYFSAVRYRKLAEIE
jgi:hypothetical protein